MLDRQVFPHDPELKPRPDLPGRLKYELTDQDFKQVMPDGRFLVVPAGYVTDGASIPRFFWRFIGSPYGSAYIYPALVHDFRYEAHGHPWDLKYLKTPHQRGIIQNEMAKETTKKKVDQDFHAGLLAAGMGTWKAKMMYWAVRVGGRWADT